MSSTRLVVLVLFLFVGFSLLNYSYARHNVQLINTGIAALDPTRKPSAQEWAALEHAMSAHMTIGNETLWFLVREVGLAIAAGAGIILLYRKGKGSS